MAESSGEEFKFVILRKDDTSELWNTGLEVIFMLMGRGILYESGDTKVYTVARDDIFVINSFCLRRIELEEGALAIALRIEPRFLSAISPETASVPINCRSFLHGRDGQQVFDVIRRDFARAFEVYYKTEGIRSVYLRSRIAVLLEDFNRYFLDREAQVRNESGRERLRPAINYIQENFRENITLEDLAQKTWLSKNYISHSFQKYIGVSFYSYLTVVRVMHGAMLLESSKTVTDIAYECGFASANAMIRAFKQYRGITPGEYRKKLLKRQSLPDGALQAEMGFSNVFASLFKYLDGSEDMQEKRQPKLTEIQADVKKGGRAQENHWRVLINAGYARDVLNGTLQKQIKKVQENIGFEYIRVKGFLDDDMAFYVPDMLGQVRPNYTYMDEVIDFILSVNAKPWIELGHMPGAAAVVKKTLSLRNMSLSASLDISLWESLISGVMEHFLARYGEREISRWVLGPWVTPTYGPIGGFSFDEYTSHYITAYKMIRRFFPHIKICGGGCEYNNTLFVPFLEMCRKNNCMPDIVTIRSFAAISPGEEKNGLKLIGNNECFYLAVSGDEQYLTHGAAEARRLMEQHGAGQCFLAAEEWSNNIWQRDLCNDTCYKSAYIFKSVIENGEAYDGLGYFAIGDQMDEVPPTPELFHGGFGLFTKNGLAKSAFRAMELLVRMGQRNLAQTEGCLITDTSDEIQIFLYNYVHYDILYRYRHTVNISPTDRYNVFNDDRDHTFNIVLQGLMPGQHRITTYGISPEDGSVYDAWIHMGAPKQLSHYEEKYLKRMSWPGYFVEEKAVDGDLNLQLTLKPHEVVLLTILKEGEPIENCKK